MCAWSVRLVSKRPWMWLSLITLGVIAALTLPSGLTPNARYELGSQEVSDFGATGTFTHRPLMHRWLIAALAAPAKLVSHDVETFEIGIRAMAMLLCFGAATLLYLGLRRFRRDLAMPVALAVAAAMLLVSPGITFEPDWLAVPIAVAGLGVALMFRRVWVSGVLGGVLLAVAAAIKIITLPTALLALLALLILDRRRFLITTTAALVSGLGWIVWVFLVVPREFQWLVDTASLQPARGAAWTLQSTAEIIGNAATLWPLVALIPMVFVGAVRREKLIILAALVLAWLPVQVQNQFNLYHLAPLAVLGAVCMVRTVQRSRGGGGSIAVLIAASAWTAWVLTTTPAWRDTYQGIVYGVVALLALGGLVAQYLHVRRATTPPHRRHWRLVAAGGVLLAMVPASLPSAAWSVTMRDDNSNSARVQGNLTEARHEYADELHARIGSDTPVIYLALGDRAYLIGNPTPCRYPTNVFLQRSRYIPELEETASFQDNLKCLADPTADYLIWDPDWFSLDTAPASVREAVVDHYDCARAFRSDSFIVCPRRNPL